MDAQQNLFILFWVIVIGFLVVDLGYFNRRAHTIGPKSALIQSIFWVSISFCFAFLILLFLGSGKAASFMTAYAVEKMLSVDNLFVFMLMFSFFKLDEKYHHKVLFWGILGAVIFRAIFIVLGAFIISQFHWVMYIFGAILIYTGIKLFKDKKEEHINFENNLVFRFAKKYLPFTTNHHNGKFFAREHGKLHVTMLFMILLIVETTDIIFAVDSIPAAFAITQDPFIVFTSNIFAVMGLRALFFLLQNVLHKFHHLQKGLSFVLILIGAKMLLTLFGFYLLPLISFGIIMSVLGISLLLSVIFPKKI
ncbi:MAG: Tellurium resistance protein TerC [Candidatus Levybacteria bacterium]|nr:Tellurium resistance protein TerC [Candidatus Levybacteria bacterium]